MTIEAYKAKLCSLINLVLTVRLDSLAYTFS